MSKKKNRGKEGSDDVLFGSQKAHKTITEAIKDMNYLLSRGFAERSSTQLVGNRYRLNSRQQNAVRGMSASSEQITKRKGSEINSSLLNGEIAIIDGLNVLILLESALSDAYLFEGLDGAIRDLSSVHGTYRKVNQTLESIHLVGKFLDNNSVKKTIWVLDKPVSNSGRLKTLLLEIAEQENYTWEVILDNNPDQLLAESKHIAISSDAWILDRAERWFNLVKEIIRHNIPNASIVKPN